MAEASNDSSVPDSSKKLTRTTDLINGTLPISEMNEKASSKDLTKSQKSPFEDENAKQFYNKFMGPQLDELESNMQQQMKVFDDLNKQWENERNAKDKKIRQQHVPQLLKNGGQSQKELYKRISGLFMHSNFAEEYKEKSQIVDKVTEASKSFNELVTKMQNFKPDDSIESLTIQAAEEEEASDDEFTDEDLIKSELPPLSDVDQQVLLSHSFAAYITRLPQDHRERFYKRIHNDTSRWIREIFRVKDSVALFHDETEDGLVNVCRLALADKYPDYLEKGFESLYTKPPVIYISAASESRLAQRLCYMLALPESCICTVPCKTAEPGQFHKLDTDAFESLVGDHSTSTREPLLLVAHASTPLLGQADPLSKLKSICKNKGIWMHVEGLNLASLCLMSTPTNMVPVRTSDSCTLHMSSWFDFPGVPSVTLYKKECCDLANKLGLSRNTKRLLCFPLWVALQAVGIDGLTSKVNEALNMAKTVMEALSKIPTVTILNKKPSTKTKAEVAGLGDLIGRMLSTLLVFEVATPIVIFKYGKSRETVADVAPYAQCSEEVKRDEDEGAMLMRYYDSLNVWFVGTMKRECPHVRLETVQIEGYGTAVKFSPLEHSHVMGTRESHIKEFCEISLRQISIMDATVSYKKLFHEIVDAQDNLRYVELPGWAGMGAVQYIPTEWLESLNDLSDQGKSEINKINTQLVHQLKSNDSAFSLGHTADMLACARFGLITQETDMEELLGLVYSAGKEIDESTKFAQQMAEIVKHGIEQANKDLERENESRLIQEGVLRQVPLVGSLVNWWSPPSKEMSNIKGRTFNLSSGEIFSTEETYKHKVQIKKEEETRKQGPLKNILKQPEKRSHPASSTSPDSSSYLSDPLTSTHTHPGTDESVSITSLTSGASVPSSEATHTEQYSEVDQSSATNKVDLK